MGDRVSVSFSKDKRESVALFAHWGGMSFVAEARKYLKELKKKHMGKSCQPIERLEPDTIMVDFIRHITCDVEEVQSNLYLGKDGNDGDNSDNGHHVIEVNNE